MRDSLVGAAPAIAAAAAGGITALVVGLLLTPFVRDHAEGLGLLDHLHERKVHTSPVPRVGGVAIFVAFLLGLIVAAVVHPAVHPRLNTPLGALLTGAAGMMVLGLVDDVRPLGARSKLGCQVIVAGLTALLGLRVSGLIVPLVGTVHLSLVASVALTMLWQVGFTNAFNLIDGVDGLAAGIALFATAALALVAALNGSPDVATTAAIVAGGVLAFLRYNYPPATIFLGDSGSLFLGFLLAGLGLISTRTLDNRVALAVPLVILGIPLIDTSVAIIRRFVSGVPIFAPDRGHIHHRVLSFGYSPREVALLFYGIAVALATGGILLTKFPVYSLLGLLLAGVTSIAVVWRLRFFEFQELGMSMRRGLSTRASIGQNVRFRQVSVQIAALQDMDAVFRALTNGFAGGTVERAEVRLRRAFASAVVGEPVAVGRAGDELSIWAWTARREASPECWELGLPLLDHTGRRFGSLVIWDVPRSRRTNLAHLDVLASHLRTELERKIAALVDCADAGHVAPSGDRYSDRVVAREDERGTVTSDATTVRPSAPAYAERAARSLRRA